MDFKNAYPSVRFQWIQQQMHKALGPDGIVLSRILLGGNSQVINGKYVGESFCQQRGVKQGDVPAPFMFNIALNSILDEIEHRVKGKPIGTFMVKLLAYNTIFPRFAKKIFSLFSVRPLAG